MMVNTTKLIFLYAIALTGIFAKNVHGQSQFGTEIQRSGNIYHANVCAHGNPIGTARCHARIAIDGNGNPSVKDRLIPLTLANPSIAPYGPSGLWQAYNISLTSTTINGKNYALPATALSSAGKRPIIAIVDAYGYSNASKDLATYRTTFNLPPLPDCVYTTTTTNYSPNNASNSPCFAKLNQNGIPGNYPAPNSGWAQESALDIQMASAICPLCSIALIEAKSATFNDLAVAVNVAKTIGAKAISNSYGGSESSSLSSLNTIYTSAPTYVITASSGDSGYAAGPQMPASFPGVMAVGGTSLFPDSGNSRRWRETAWSGAGSGCSKVYKANNWQLGGICNGWRSISDVSAVADPATGVLVYYSGKWYQFGGTSASSPIIAGIYALNGSKPVTNNNGTPNPYSSTNYLNDVVNGNNGTCSQAAICTAIGGIDGPTGLGTPNGANAF